MTGTIRGIRIFVAAYEEGSFTAAAEREHATQSGVSQHVRNLEDCLGVTLFLRSKGKIATTPVGEAYYRACVELLKWHEASVQVTRPYAKGLDGEVVVGLMPTLTRCALAPALAGFVETHPNVTIRVVEEYSATLTKMVHAGELDFAIVPAAPSLPGIKTHMFLRTPEVLVSGTASVLTNLAPVRLAGLGEVKIVVPGDANARRHTLNAYFNASSVSVARTVELDSMLGTLDFIACSDWLAVLPAVLMDPKNDFPKFTINHIVDPELSLDLVMIELARRPLSAQAKAFLDGLWEESSDQNNRWLSRLTLGEGVTSSPVRKADQA